MTCLRNSSVRPWDELVTCLRNSSVRPWAELVTCLRNSSVRPWAELIMCLRNSSVWPWDELVMCLRKSSYIQFNCIVNNYGQTFNLIFLTKNVILLFSYSKCNFTTDKSIIVFFLIQNQQINIETRAELSLSLFILLWGNLIQNLP